MNIDFYKKPPEFCAFEDKINEIKLLYNFVDISIIGKSHLGRNIYALSVGSKKSTTLYAGAFHAQEWLTTSLLMKFFEDLCYSIKHKTTISDSPVYKTLGQRGITVIPMVNPDGVEIALNGSSSAKQLSEYVDIISTRDDRSWQANAVGVDLNHNFDAGYDLLKELESQSGISVPSPRQFGGMHAHSEPEVQALVDFCLHNKIRCAYAFHSQGEEIFYQYGQNTPPKSKFIARLLSLSSGYTLVENTGLCSHGGFKDWVIDKLNRPAFTIEIGKGENPLPITHLDYIYNNLLEMLVIGMLC